MLARRLLALVTVLAAMALLAACSGADRPAVVDRAGSDAAAQDDGARGESESGAAHDGPQTRGASSEPASSPSPAPTSEPTPPSEPTPSPRPLASPSPEPSAARDAGTDAQHVGLEPVGDGDRGEAVRHVQSRLDELGYAPGASDGVFGRRTAAAIAAYQHQAGIDPTGEADDPTIAALDAGEHEHRVLRPGDEGTAVRALQEALADGPLDPGPADGLYGTKTAQAVHALEKTAGLVVDGAWDGTDVHALSRLGTGDVGAAEDTHERRWVEVDLSRQLMTVYDAGRPQTPLLISHVSTGNGERWCNDTAGCRVASTPTGSFTITRRIAGWRESSLDIGRLYNPLYFRGGIALHGALSVPTHPASHGCVRVPMHIAEYLPDLLPDGTPVEVTA